MSLAGLKHGRFNFVLNFAAVCKALRPNLSDYPTGMSSLSFHRMWTLFQNIPTPVDNEVQTLIEPHLLPVL